MFGNDYGRDERENSSPINEGEEYDVKIEDLGFTPCSSFTPGLGYTPVNRS